MNPFLHCIIYLSLFGMYTSIARTYSHNLMHIYIVVYIWLSNIFIWREHICNQKCIFECGGARGSTRVNMQ